MPAPVLDDDRAVQGAKDAASFGDHANQTESNAASFFAIEVSRNGHGDGDDGATSSGLYKAGRDQPDKTWRVNIQAEGIYTFTAKVSDSTGTFYEDKIDIIALSKAELENRLVSKWEGMKGALLSGNMEVALSFFVPGAQDRYRQVFEELGSDGINSLFSSINGVELDTASGRAAEGGLIREENGNTYSYPITFVQDQNGIWKIMGF